MWAKTATLFLSLSVLCLSLLPVSKTTAQTPEGLCSTPVASGYLASYKTYASSQFAMTYSADDLFILMRLSNGNLMTYFKEGAYAMYQDDFGINSSAVKVSAGNWYEAVSNDNGVTWGSWYNGGSNRSWPFSGGNCYYAIYNPKHSVSLEATNEVFPADAGATWADMEFAGGTPPPEPCEWDEELEADDPLCVAPEEPPVDPSVPQDITPRDAKIMGFVLMMWVSSGIIKLFRFKESN